MADDDRKLTYSERDRMRREGGRPPTGRAARDEAQASKAALAAADALFTADHGGDEGKALGDAVREAHGTAALAEACRAYVDGVGVPVALDLASVFLDAGDKDLSVLVLDELLRQKDAGALALEGGLKRQIRLLSEDFDDDLASRAEDLLE